MDCPSCLFKYNVTNKVPIFITSCGHTMCAECVNKLSASVCPRCKTKFDTDKKNFPKNHEILKLIEDKNKSHEDIGLCPKSRELEEYYCNDCNSELCLTCLDGHLNHKFQKLNAVEFKIKRKLLDFKSRLAGTISEYQQYIGQLETAKDSIEQRKVDRLNDVNKYFEDLVQKTKEVQQKATREIGGTFSYIINNEFKKKILENNGYVNGLNKLNDEVNKSDSNLMLLKNEHGTSPGYSDNLKESFDIFEAKMDDIIQGYKAKLEENVKGIYSYDPKVNLKLIKKYVAKSAEITPEDLEPIAAGPEPKNLGIGINKDSSQRFLV